MAVRVQFDVALAVGPSTQDFLFKYETLFDKKLVFALRKGAPLIQMLEAPDDFAQGSAEPWIVDVLCALLKASDQHSVLECGAFLGQTTVRLATTLAAMGGGRVVAVECEHERALATEARLAGAALPLTVTWYVVEDDVLKYIAQQPDESIGFAWVDDTHEHEHVARELELLLPKMTVGGLVCGHDVWGSCALHAEFERFGGYALDFPRLGPAGGIGMIQRR